MFPPKGQQLELLSTVFSGLESVWGRVDGGELDVGPALPGGTEGLGGEGFGGQGRGGVGVFL